MPPTPAVIAAVVIAFANAPWKSPACGRSRVPAPIAALTAQRVTR